MSDQSQPTEPKPPTNSPNRNKTILAVVLGVAILLVLGLIIWAITSDDDSGGGGGSAQTSGDTSASDATPEQISAGQAALAAVGCYDGSVDGVYGPETEQAVRDFQAAKDLTVDGIFGPETRSAIEASLAAGETVCTDSGTPTATPVPVQTVQFTTSDGINQTLDLVNCSTSEGGGLSVTAKTETSDLNVDWDGASGSMAYTSADGNRDGIVTSATGSDAGQTTTLNGDLSADSGTFQVVAPCK